MFLAWSSFTINVVCHLIADYYYYRDYYRPIPGEDFEFQNVNMSSPTFNFTISAGATRSFDVTIIDDSIAEMEYEHLIFYIGLYDSDGMNYCDSDYIYIEDNDGNILQ